MKAIDSLQSTLRTLALAGLLAALVACGGGGGGGFGPAAPSVTSITPLVATENTPAVFTVVGVNLPLTAALVAQDASCAAATGNTATGFTQKCTFLSTGQKGLVVPVGSGYSFTVNVSSAQYVKICNDGSREGTFSCPFNPVQGNASNEWACTLDKLTNQMWEVKTNDGGLRDYAKGYTIYDDTTKNQKSVGGNVVPPTQADIDAATNVVGYTKALNGLTGLTPLCGSTQWRVPKLTELATLVKGTVAPTIDAAYFPNTRQSYYITSTPQINTNYNLVPPALVTVTNSISIVNFSNGGTSSYITRDYIAPARLVSEPLPTCLTFNNNGLGPIGSINPYYVAYNGATLGSLSKIQTITGRIWGTAFGVASLRTLNITSTNTWLNQGFENTGPTGGWQTLVANSAPNYTDIIDVRFGILDGIHPGKVNVPQGTDSLFVVQRNAQGAYIETIQGFELKVCGTPL